MGQKDRSAEEKAIIEGWGKIMTDYKPRGLNPVEMVQLEMAIAIERVEKITPFVLV